MAMGYGYNLVFCSAYLILSLLIVLICFKIRSFYLQKPPGILNITDLITSDLNIMQGTSAMVTSLICIVGLLYGPFTYVTSLVLTIFVVLSWGVTAIYVPALCIMRYLIIFHYHWLNQLLDWQIQTFVRVASLVIITLSLALAKFMEPDSFEVFQFFLLMGKENNEDSSDIPSAIIASMIIIAAIIHMITQIRVARLNNLEVIEGQTMTEQKYSNILADMVIVFKDQKKLLFGLLLIFLVNYMISLSLSSILKDPNIVSLASMSTGGLSMPLLQCYVNKKLGKHIFGKFCCQNKIGSAETA